MRPANLTLCVYSLKIKLTQLQISTKYSALARWPSGNVPDCGAPGSSSTEIRHEILKREIIFELKQRE